MTFSIVAVDLGTPLPLSATATIHVNVIDVDDHAPTFDKREYVFAVYENRPSGIDVGHVTLVDRDATDGDASNFGFRYDIVPDIFLYVESDRRYPSGSQVFDEFPLPFSINPTTGRIVTRSVLDRERRAEYQLCVLAYAVDGVFRSVTSTARVLVHVLDVNDNRPTIHWPPRIPLTSDSVRVSSATPPGHVIAVVSADDPDVGENGRLQFAIVGNELEPLSLFGIASPDEGRIIVRDSLAGRLEAMTSSSDMPTRSFALTIVVSDCGSPSMTATTVINIVVDATLPFAHAHQTVSAGINRNAVNNGDRYSTAAIVVMSCLSSMFVLLLVAVVVVSRRYLADRQRNSGQPKTNGSVAIDAGCGPPTRSKPLAARLPTLSGLKKRVMSSYSTSVEIGSSRLEAESSPDDRFLPGGARFHANKDDEETVDEWNQVKKRINSTTRQSNRGGTVMRPRDCAECHKVAVDASCGTDRRLLPVRDGAVVVIRNAEVGTTTTDAGSYFRV